MKEGTVPVPQIAPALCDSGVLPSQELSHVGGAEAAGVKPP
jgi:hypothetical protein